MWCKELEDYDWFPKILRRYQMEIIGTMVVRFGVYKKFISTLHNIAHKTNNTAVNDLCSGSGLPSLYCSKKLNHLQFNLSDKHPQPFTNQHNICYNTNNVDILTLQPQRNGLYTMYNAWHHFTVAEQQNIMNAFIQNNATLCIVEIVQPRLLSLLQVMLASTIGTLLIVPFIKPFSFTRLLFTYVLPINIITVFVDGVLSILKSKTKKQYQKLINELPQHNFNITVQELKQFPAQLIVIIATPNNENT
jgi:hypothetical protein